MGFGPGAVDAAPPEVWECNAESVELLMALEGQWHVNAATGTPMGLMRSAVIPTLELMGVPRRRWRALFADLRTMEAAARKAMRSSA